MSKASVTEHHGKCLTCKSFVILGFWWRMTNRTIRWLVPSAVPLRRAGVEQLVSGKANDWRNREHVCVCAVHDSLKVAKLSLPPPPSPISSSFLSFSVSLSPCLRVMLRWCCVVVCVCLVCVCVGVRVCLCVGRGGGTVCTFKTPSVSRFKTSPCAPAPRAHVFQHVHVVPAHMGTF